MADLFLNARTLLILFFLQWLLAPLCRATRTSLSALSSHREMRSCSLLTRRNSLSQVSVPVPNISREDSLTEREIGGLRLLISKGMPYHGHTRDHLAKSEPKSVQQKPPNGDTLRSEIHYGREMCCCWETRVFIPQPKNGRPRNWLTVDTVKLT